MFVSAIVLAATIYPKLSTGPSDFEVVGEILSETENCRKYWWRSLLYIGNLFNDQPSVSKIQILQNLLIKILLLIKFIL